MWCKSKEKNEVPKRKAQAQSEIWKNGKNN
jgi:hypothetical protein